MCVCLYHALQDLPFEHLIEARTHDKSQDAEAPTLQKHNDQGELNFYDEETIPGGCYELNINDNHENETDLDSNGEDESNDANKEENNDGGEEKKDTHFTRPIGTLLPLTIDNLDHEINSKLHDY